MKVMEYCKASALEAVSRASDPSLSLEARIEWARISKVWQDITQHYGLIEDLGTSISVDRGPDDTVH